jgi:TolB-like protein
VVEAQKPVERRLAAILVADVAGYGRLTQSDEEGTLARLRTLQRELFLPKIAEHRGRVVKTTGDGMLVEFASVVDAVRCAFETQRALGAQNAPIPADRRIELRIGINLGDVMVEDDGDLMGDSVNVAARLEALAEPGGICVSEDAYRYLRGKVDAVFTDLGAQRLKNVAEPVRVYAVAPWGAAPSTRAAATTSNRAPRLSIVVLPFANLSGDPEQDYFVDGVTESLTTDLSRIFSAFVIACSTAFAYKGKVADLRKIARELNVRYVLEGSVQRSRGRMRVNVQLIDGETGRHLWAERFDKPIADLFDMQDEIVARIANQLQAELVTAEARRAQQAPNPDAIDLVFQGRAALYRGFSPDMLAQARRCFERALELDPGNVDALVGAATVNDVVGSGHMTDDPRPFMAAAETALSKALAAAPHHARAHCLMGMVLCSTNRASRGIDELERALAIDPNLAIARGFMGLAHVFIGRADETEAHVLEALRLSPRDAFVYLWFLNVGYAKMCLGQYEEALLWLRKSIDANRNNPWAFLDLAACLAHLGHLDEARAEVRALLEVEPRFTIAHVRRGVESDNAVYLAQYERVIEGMRNAGVPEE